MDLKNRFLALGLEESIVSRILPMIKPNEAQFLYEANDEEIKKKIPELLERIVNKEEFDINSHGLTAPNNHKTNTGSPLLVKNNSKQSSKLKSLLFLSLTFTALICFLAFFLSSHSKKRNGAPTNNSIVESETLVNSVQESNSNLKPIEVQSETPRPPDFRAAWMFMPWDNYKASIICNDGRFKDLNDKYTIQFWLKLTKSFPTKVNILEFISGKSQLETVYLNEYGHICFKAGPNYPTLVLMKKIPTNGRHFHIAITRNGDFCRLYVNGKLRKEQQLLLIPSQNQLTKEFILLLRSKSTLKGIAIDELMISNEILFEKDFQPERILTLSESTVLYIPFEKNETNSILCYGSKNFRDYPLTGGKWLNVLNEVQQIINQLEFEGTKDHQSNSSAP